MEKISEKLAEYINFLRSCVKDYENYCSLLNDEEKKRTDLLHALEMDKSGYKERYKISTKLPRCLLQRRLYKDKVEELMPIAEFLSHPQNKGLLDKFAQVLGETRKAERYHENRTYKPRILKSSAVDINNVTNLKKQNTSNRDELTP